MSKPYERKTMATRNEIGDRMLFAVNELNENEDPRRIAGLIHEFQMASIDFALEFLNQKRTYDYQIGRSFGMPDE